MGWAAGSSLGCDIWEEVREYIPEEKRVEVARYIYDAVCDLDADDWDGSSQLEIDAQIPLECWECGEEYPAHLLDDDHLCKNCKDKE